MAIKNESVSQIDLSNLTRTQSVELLELLNAYDERLRYNKLEYYYPDKGPYARSFYQKHVEFFKAGREYKERIIFGANRSGKSIANTYECALHLTGLYPDWWEGIRFYTPTTCLMASDTFDRSRDILQRYLLGPLSDLGSGTIPKNCFQGCQRSPIDLREGLFTKPNVPQGISVAYIKHYTMGVF